MLNEWNILNWGSEIEQDGVTINKNIVLKGRSQLNYLNNYETHYIKSSELEKLCKIPKPNEQYRIVTEKQFNAFALIISLLKTYRIDELWIAIYRINQPTVYAIIDMIEKGLIKKGGFVISNFFNQTKKPEKWAVILKEFCENNDNFKHIYTHNHSKIACIKTECNNYFVFEGSGNMSDNARIEQYVYENCKNTYDFHVNWMKEIVN